MIFEKNSKKFFLSLLIIGFLFVPIFCSLAFDSSFGLDNTAKAALGVTDLSSLKAKDPTVIVGTIVGVVLSVLGVIFLIEIIVAGISWLLAQGNEEKITKAKQTIIHSTIGLLIVVGAYVFVNFILTEILKVFGIGTPTPPAAP